MAKRIHPVIIVLIAAALLSLVEYLGVSAAVASSGIRVTRLTQLFALSAVAVMYAGLIYYPLRSAIPRLAALAKAKLYAVGLLWAGFYFAVWHMLLAFFTQLNGFAGLPFLNDRYLQAIVIGFISLFCLLALASVFLVLGKLPRLRLKALAAAGYALLLLVTLHALMLGNHFADLASVIPQLFLAALALMLILLGIWCDQYLKNRGFELSAGVTTVLSIVIVAVVLVVQFAIPEVAVINVHADHGTGSDSATGLPVPQPAAPAANRVTKTAGGYNVTLFKPLGTKRLELDLERINAEMPEIAGQGTALFVNEATYESFTAEAILDDTKPGNLIFNIDLSDPAYAPGVYSIYVKLYLATGGLQVNFTVALN